MLGAAVTLVLPLLVRYINQYGDLPAGRGATRLIHDSGLWLRLVMVAVEAVSNYYITYFGHMMGARIERDMRDEIFGHYQKLSFTFYDNQKVGHLLSRVTSDLLILQNFCTTGRRIL